MAKPSVLIIENAVDVTGGLNAALRSSTALRNDFDFTFVLPAHSRARRPIEASQFSVVEFPLIEIRRNALTIFRYGPSLLFNMLRLFRLVGKTKSDVIVA